MITDWRAKFNSSQGVLPFLFVQLAAWTDQARFVAPQRQAQTSALTLPKVGMATAIDLGDATSPYGMRSLREASQLVA
jgi:sialate O-acetylesterase